MTARHSEHYSVLSLKTTTSQLPPNGESMKSALQLLSILLFGSECWTPLRRHLNRLNGFHHRCIRMVLGITNRQQWEQCITSARTREMWGDRELVETKITKRRLEWLGHVARMPCHRMPKQAWFDGCQKLAHREALVRDGETRF